MDFTTFFKTKIEPFIAIGIFLMLIGSCWLLYDEHKLKKEISENCGWEGEGYKCYCEKSQALYIKGLIDKQSINLSLELGNITSDYEAPQYTFN